jgi:hypothetical protein
LHILDLGKPSLRLPASDEIISFVIRIVAARPYDPQTYHIARHILSIATQHLELSVLREHVTGLLQDNWPQTLEGWDALQRHIQSLSRTLSQSTSPESSRTLLQSLPNASTALNLAREHRVPTLLPPIFVTLAMIPSLSDIDFDDIFSIPHFDHPTRFNPRYRTTEWSLLAVDNLQAIREGQHFFRDRIRNILKSFFDPERNVLLLRGHAGCIHALVSLVTRDEIMDAYFYADLLGFWQLIIDRSQPTEDGLCTECAEELVLCGRGSRQEVWDTLTQIFNIQA